MPNFLPERFAGVISRPAYRWNVSAALLSAQIYAESNCNPFAHFGKRAPNKAESGESPTRGRALGA